MYNKNKFRWYYYSNGKQENKDQDTTIHHIIPYETLKPFWNTIVDYYPELWGGMVKNILDNVNRVLTSGNTVYCSDYQNQLNMVGQNIENAIDQEAKILKDKAFGGKDKNKKLFCQHGRAQ